MLLMAEIGIVDTRNIINIVTEKYGYDFSDYALTSFKRRIEKIIDQNNLKYPDILHNKLIESRDFFEVFIDQLSVPSSEMFRDPSLWRLMREGLIESIYQESGGCFKIWLPNSVSGDELFTLTIMLSEIGMLDKVQILVSSLSDKSLDTIKSGIFSGDKLEISIDNYTRANGKSNLSNYYKSNSDHLVRDVSLIANTIFFKQDTFLEPAPQGIKLVLFRNKMIYFNQTLQSRILKTIYNSTANNGTLVIGTKESLNYLYGSNAFALVNDMESIYKRR
jgi:chemotaxis protein methyltransferase CheR